MTQYSSICLLLWTILLATHSSQVDATLSKNMWSRHLLEQSVGPSQTNFTEDFNSVDSELHSLQHGLVLLYVFGGIYMFIALIILCDKFYVPSIYLISRSLSIPKEVAGCTFMAAGVALRHFVTIFISSFDGDPISFGSFVGEFLYNATLVTSACAFASRARISCRTFLETFSFSIVGIVVFGVVALDQTIYWYESIAMFLIYGTFWVFLMVPRKFCTKKRTQNMPLPLETMANPSTTTDHLEGHDQTEDSCPYEPISLKWPRSFKARLIYILTLPIVLPLWISLPDSSTARGKKFYVWTFIGSVIWMFGISYLVTQWLIVSTNTFGIPRQISAIIIYGLTSPDLITSVIVAKRGFGDMALAAANGRNIFLICVSSTLPWMLSGLILKIRSDRSYQLKVSTDGIACSITLAIIFSVSQIPALACFKWRLGIGLGIVMLTVYILFVIVSLAFVFQVIVCPI